MVVSVVGGRVCKLSFPCCRRAAQPTSSLHATRTRTGSTASQPSAGGRDPAINVMAAYTTCHRDKPLASTAMRRPQLLTQREGKMLADASAASSIPAQQPHLLLPHTSSVLPPLVPVPPPFVLCCCTSFNSHDQFLPGSPSCLRFRELRHLHISSIKGETCAPEARSTLDHLLPTAGGSSSGAGMAKLKHRRNASCMACRARLVLVRSALPIAWQRHATRHAQRSNHQACTERQNVCVPCVKVSDEAGCIVVLVVHQSISNTLSTTHRIRAFGISHAKPHSIRSMLKSHTQFARNARALTLQQTFCSNCLGRVAIMRGRT